jgi:hypothetical protein
MGVFLKELFEFCALRFEPCVTDMTPDTPRLFLAQHLIKAWQITHQNIRKELRNILEYFIFGVRYFLVEYLNFCVHRIG